MLAQIKIRVFAFSTATSLPVTGDAINITTKWAKDYGTPTALTDTNPTEAEDGFYYFDLSAGERNVAVIGEAFPSSSSPGVQVIGVPGAFMIGNTAEILTVLQSGKAVQVPSPNVRGNLVLTQGDTYDGIGNPKAQWTVSFDYTDGWSVIFSIRDKHDAIIYTTAGAVDSATQVSVTIDTPTGLPMSDFPPVWKGKFDVQLTKGSSIKTIALGSVFINEDVTRE